MASQTNSTSLYDHLADALPEGSNYTFYHVSTPPTKCEPIFAAPRGAKPERTYRETHFLNVSIKPPSSESTDEVFAVAMEIFIYSTKHLTTIFVSKADSTGFISLLNLPKATPSPLRTITTSFISYLVQHRQPPGKRLVVSLFARAQNQYLYPGSVDNPSKHVSDDRQLVKWWCRVLDPVLQEYAAESEQTADPDAVSDEPEKTTSQAYVLVPGEDSNAQFLPPHVRADPTLRKRWKNGHPLVQISSHPTAPPRCLVPRFPDDPKSRFLDELDEELPDAISSVVQDSPSKRGSGQWKSVKTLSQFWDTMQFRQECSSGRLVGFIWVVFTPPDTKEPTDEQGDSQKSSSSLKISSSPTLPPRNPTKPKSPKKRKRLTGPIIPRLPRIKSGSSNLSSMTLPESSNYYSWPVDSRGEIVLDEKGYKRAHELLLRLDFAKRDVAAASTARWIEEVAVLSGVTGSWGKKVVGRRESTPAPTATQNVIDNLTPSTKGKAEDAGRDTVNGENILDGNLVRKKPKTTDSEAASQQAQPGKAPEVNVLGAGLVRKKRKSPSGDEAKGEATGAPEVHVLGEGIVRKKAKT